MAKLDLIGIIVQDMGRSLRFYRLLGMEIPLEADHEPHVEATLPGGLRFAWDTIELMSSLHEGWETPVGNRIALAFLCESPAEVDAQYQRLVDAGYHGLREPWDAFWGQRYANVLDPDGNLIDLFAWA